MTWQSILLYSIIFLLILYLLTCAGYLLLHRYFIIFPSRKLRAFPSDYQMQYEEVYFSTNDMVRLYGWFIKGVPDGKWNNFTVLLFPGNKGTMSDFLLQMKQLTGIGFNVFLFGYRGFGKSQKKLPTEEGVYEDSEAACEYLAREKNIPVKKIIFLGQSLGCAMASRTAHRFDPCALIIEGGFPSLVEVASRSVKWLPIGLLTRQCFDTEKFLTGVKCPVLIIHSYEDNAIPVSDADRLFDAVEGPKKKVIISGQHAKGLDYDTERYLMEADKFLNDNVRQISADYVNLSK